MLLQLLLLLLSTCWALGDIEPTASIVFEHLRGAMHPPSSSSSQFTEVASSITSKQHQRHHHRQQHRAPDLSLSDMGEMVSAAHSLASHGAGDAWAPMTAYARSDAVGLWDAQQMRDFRGWGMQRDGTYNVVEDLGECLDQCQMMDECRVAFYDRVSKQCWLDSRIADESNECPSYHVTMTTHSSVPKVERIYAELNEVEKEAGLNYRSDCITFFKRRQIADERNRFGVVRKGAEITDDTAWIQVHGSAWLADAAHALIRNGRHNTAARNVQACADQCGELSYCRVALYYAHVNECWLSSRLSTTAKRCALRAGERNCTSVLKVAGEPSFQALKEDLVDDLTANRVQHVDVEAHLPPEHATRLLDGAVLPLVINVPIVPAQPALS